MDWGDGYGSTRSSDETVWAEDVRLLGVVVAEEGVGNCRGLLLSSLRDDDFCLRFTAWPKAFGSCWTISRSTDCIETLGICRLTGATGSCS